MPLCLAGQSRLFHTLHACALLAAASCLFESLVCVITLSVPPWLPP